MSSPPVDSQSQQSPDHVKQSVSPNSPPESENTESEGMQPGKIRVRTIRRVNGWFCLGVAVCGVTLATCVYFIHGFQVHHTAETLLSRANAAEEEGDLKTAIRYLNHFVQFRPNRIDELSRLGILIDDTSKNDPKKLFRAYSLYENVLRKEPERDGISRRLIDVSMKLGRYKNVLGLLEKEKKAATQKAAKLKLNKGTPNEPFPEAAEVAFLAGRCQQALQDYQLASKRYLDAIILNEQHVEYYAALAALVIRQADNVPLKEIASQFEADTEGTNNSVNVAERILETMVEKGQPRYKAYLSRAKYWMQKDSLERADEDVNGAFEVVGDLPDVLLVATDVCLAQARVAQQYGNKVKVEELLQTARQHAKRGLQQDPPNLRFYVSLSQVELQLTRTVEAEKQLRNGLAAVDAAREKLETGEIGQLDEVERRLVWFLAELLISEGSGENGEFDPARSQDLKEQITRLREIGESSQRIDFLEGRHLVAQQEWYQAGLRFQDIRFALVRWPDLIRRLDSSLGLCYERLGNPDARVQVFRSALRADPLWSQGRLQLAAAYAASNRIDEAIVAYQFVTTMTGVHAAMARLLILKQLALPAKQRQWGDVERALAIEEDIWTRRGLLEPAEVAILRAEVLTLQNKFREAGTKLDRARQNHPEEAVVWTSLASLALRRDDKPRSERSTIAKQIIDEAQEKLGDQVEFRLSRATLALLEPSGTARKLLAELEADWENFSEDESSRLFQGLARAYALVGETKKARLLWEQLAKRRKNDIRPWLALVQFASRARDEKAFTECLNKIRRIEGPAGPNGNYLEASFLVHRSRRDGNYTNDLEQARELLTQAARRRPYWAVVPQTLSTLEDRLGNREAAFDHARKAISLGSRSQDVIFRVVNALHQQERFEEANQELLRLTAERPSLLSGQMKKLAASVAWAVGVSQDSQVERDRALGLMSEIAVETGRVRDRILEAQLLLANGKPADAELKFEKIVEEAPQEWEAWYALVGFLARQQRTKEAVERIEEARGKLPKEEVSLALARCYDDLLNSPQRAEEHYRKALQDHPDDVRLMRMVAGFYARIRSDGSADKALVQIEKILDPKTNAPSSTVGWARRTKAVLIASKGGYRNFKEALQTLENVSQEEREVSLANLRAKATVLATGTNRRDQRALIKILEEIGERQPTTPGRQPLTPDEQFQLARLYEATGNWPQARSRFRRLLARYPENPIFLFDFALAATNQKNLDEVAIQEVQNVVHELERLEPGSFRTATAKARLLHVKGRSRDAARVLQSYLNRLEFTPPEQAFHDLVEQEKPQEALVPLAKYLERQGDQSAKESIAQVQKLIKEGKSDEAIAILRSLLQTSDYLEAVQTELTRIVAKLLEGIEQHQAAEEAFRQYVSRSKQAEAVLVLAAFIARRQRIAEALDLCEDAWKTCSPVDVAVVSVGVVRMGGPLAANHVPRVESQLMSAIRSSQPPVWNELMVRLADLHDFQGRHQDAARIYREILAQDQRNLVALNNLAWLLSFQSENRTEALVLINSAIELAGPAAALLDTRAVVSLNMNRVQEALQDLNAALEETQAAAIYIHLAQAQLRANDGVAAKESFQQAKDNGFDIAKLHPLERPDYNRLIRRLNDPLKNGGQTNF